MSSDPSESFHWYKRFALVALTVASASPLLMVFAGPKPAEESARGKPSSIAAALGSKGSTPQHFVVEVTGRDFRWHFRVLEPVRDANEADPGVASHRLTVPEGAVIDWNLTSDDYIYAFSIPSLAIREIAVPDVLRQWRSGPLEPGAYELLVDPICGFRYDHDALMGRVVVNGDPAEQSGFTP